MARPKDHWEVAARLEVSGIRDVDARQEYGCADVFDLAQRILALGGDVAPAPTPEPARRAPLVWRFARGYVTGLLFSMPMAAQTFAMMLYGYSLWAWVDFTPRQATAIALGTLTSFVVTGGYVQAISRRGLFYIHQDEPVLTEAICRRALWVGLVMVVGVGAVVLLANVVFEFFPLRMVVTAELYYLLLSVLWLSLSILYMLRKELLLGLIIVVGLLSVHLAVLLLKWRMVAAHSLGIAFAIALSLFCGWLILRRNARRAEREFTTTELPRWSMLLYSVAHYFWYGTLYFAFLFTDRFIAWSADTGRDLLPYFIWFESRYELGMDWALFCFVLTVGVLEFTIQEFSEAVIPAERAVPADQAEQFNRRFARFYYSHLVFFAVVSLISVVAAWGGMSLLLATGKFPYIEVFFNPTTRSVFWWAAAGYVFLVFGLFNSVFLFSLSRPGFVLRALGPALLLNVAVGFVLSRAVRYDLAVVGLTVGSLAFLLLSTYYARKVFKRLDYYYYSAY
jgi:hypothetical protein